MRIIEQCLKDWQLDQSWINNVKAMIHSTNGQRKQSAFELVTFDIFDTALTRDVTNPTDIFGWVESTLLERKLPGRGFALARKNAEDKARQRLASLNFEDIRFNDIYYELQQTELFSKETLSLAQELEYELEAQSLAAVPDIFALCQYLNQQHIPYGFVSDMYLPSDFVAKQLHKNGYENWQILLISGEINKTKATGSIWTSEALRNKKILHIGDNYHSDVLMPQKFGVSTLHYKRAYSEMRSEQALTTQILPFSRQNRYQILSLAKDPSFQALAQEAVPAASIQKAVMKATGASLGVLTVGSFVLWLRQKVQEHNIEHLFFSARDGYLPQLAWRLFNKEREPLPVKDSYIYLSRKVLVLAAGYLQSRPDHLSPIVTDLFSYYFPTQTIGKALVYANLDRADILQKARKIFNLDAQLQRKKVVNQFKAFLQDHSSVIYDQLKQHYEDVIHYCEQEGFFSEQKIGFVDLGWNGSVQKHLSVLLEHHRKDSYLHGFYYGLNQVSKGRLHQTGPMESAFYSNFNHHAEQTKAFQSFDFLEESHRSNEGATIGFNKDNDRYVPVQTPLSDKEKENFKTIIQPFQEKTLEGLETLLKTGSFGQLSFDDLTTENARAALLAFFLSPLSAEINVMAQLAHGTSFDNTAICIADLKLPKCRKDLKKAFSIHSHILALKYWQLHSNNKLNFRKFVEKHFSFLGETFLQGFRRK